MGFTFSEIVTGVIVACAVLFVWCHQFIKQQRLREGLLTALAASLKDVSLCAYRTDTPEYVNHLLQAIASALANLESLQDNGTLGDGLLIHMKDCLVHYSEALKMIKAGAIWSSPEGERIKALIAGLRPSIQKWLGEAFEDKVLRKPVVLRKRLPQNVSMARSSKK